MESEWANLRPNVDENKEKESSIYLIKLGLLTSPVWMTVLVFGFGLPVAVFSGIVYAVRLGKKDIKRNRR